LGERKEVKSEEQGEEKGAGEEKKKVRTIIGANS